MASSRFSSNVPDWKDVTSALLSLEREMNCTVTVTLIPSGTPGRPALVMEAQALAVDADQLVVRVLASARVRMPSVGVGDMCAALLSLGYELDKDLYRKSEGVSPRAA